VKANHGDIRRYLQSHHLTTLIVGFVLLSVCELVLGSLDVLLPAASSSIAFRRLLPIGFAVLVVGSVDSTMSLIEDAATSRLRHYEVGQVAVTTLVAALLLGLISDVTDSSAVAAILIRALLIWTSLAVVSARLFGPRLSWILPVATIFPLTYFGFSISGQPTWWNWTSHPISYLPCWYVAIVAFSAALAAWWLTPWRVRRALRPISGTHTRRAANPALGSTEDRQEPRRRQLR
jgi:hypothetical protein